VSDFVSSVARLVNAARVGERLGEGSRGIEARRRFCARSDVAQRGKRCVFAFA
jgi:hypothetical protein